METMSRAESASAIIHDLLRIVRHIEAALTSAFELKRCPAVNQLIYTLARRHRARVMELQAHLAMYSMGAPILTTQDRSSSWSELDDSVASTDRNAVLAACELAEHLVANAYAKALREKELEEETKTLLNCHFQDALVAQELLRNSVLAPGERGSLPGNGKAALRFRR